MKLRYIALPILAVGCQGKKGQDSGHDSKTPEPVVSHFVTVCEKPDEEQVKTIRALKNSDESCEEARVRIAGLKELNLSFKTPGNPVFANISQVHNPGPEKLTDVSVLKEFTQLEKVTLNGQQVKDMTVFSYLPRLKELDVKSNPVNEIAVPASLIRLDLTDTGLTDFKFLSHSGKLKFVYGVKESKVDAAIKIIPNSKVVVFNDKGLSQTGFNLDGIHKDTGTEFGPDHRTVDRGRFDKNGFDWKGFNKRGFKANGIHKNGTRFGKDHLTYDRKEFYEGRDYRGYDTSGFLADGIHKNGTRFGSNHLTMDGHRFYNGRDYRGFDSDGFKANGMHRNGTRFGSNHLTMDGQQYYQGRDYQGYDLRGFRQNGEHRDGGFYAPSGADLLGFAQNGEDLEGFDTAASNQFRGQKVTDMMARLKEWDFPLYNLVMADEVPHSLDELKTALNGFIGHGLTALPSDQQIYNDLLKLKVYVDSIRSYELDIAQLSHDDAGLLTHGRILDFPRLWADLNVTNDDWYLEFFNVLDAGNHYAQVDFPDETDVLLNGDSVAKRDYLIIFFGSLKNPANSRTLSPGLSASPARRIFPTDGNTATWFAEMRYRLYHLYLKRNDLSEADIKTLIGMFMHGGKHCSDAKKDQLKSALGLFNGAVETNLEMQLRDLAVTMKEKIQYVATYEKTRFLKSKVDSIYDSVVNDGNTALVYNHQSAAYVQSESITYKAATWDHYASLIGLPLNGSNYPDFRLIIHDSLTGPGAYTPRRLYNKVNTDLGQLIKDQYAGSMQFVTEYHEKLILGALIKEGFLRN